MVALGVMAAFWLLAIVAPNPAAAALSVTCSASSPGASGQLLVTISGGSTSSGQPLSIAVSSGDYVVDLNGSSACNGTFPDSGGSGFPNVQVDSATAGQYVVLDDSNGQLASHSAGCPVQVSTTAGFSGTLELDGDASPATTPDATIGVGSGTATLATGGCASDVTPGAGVATLVAKGLASANTLDLSSAPGPLTVDASAAPQEVTGFSSANVTELDFSNEQTVLGPTSGSTKFVAPTTSVTFTGQGTDNSLDLSALATSQSTAGTVNLSGSPANSLANNTATAGSVTDTFSDTSSFTGPSTGHTTFLAGSTGGYSFTGQGSSNTLDLSASGTAATIDAHAGNATIGTATDTFTDILSFIGPSVGSSRFLAATSVNDTFTGLGNGNTFVAAASGNDTFTGVGSGNTLDLSSLSAPTLNVSGITIAAISNDTATAGANIYTFSGISSFKGSSTGSSTFYAGDTGGTTFTGQSTGNTLSFAFTSGASDAILDANAGTATLGAIVEQFSGIATLVGLAAGQTTFVPDTTGAQTFTAAGSGNLLDVSPLTSPTIDVPNGHIHFGGLTDSFSDIPAFKGASTGHTTVIAPTTSITFQGQSTGNALDLSALATSQSTAGTVNLSGSPANSLANNTATAGSVTDTFSDTSSFTGPTTGHTTFLAGSTGGYSFTGQGSSNELDLSPAGAPVKVDAHSGVASFASTSDAFGGIGSFLVPAVSGNTFVAGPTNATFNGGSDNALDLSPVSGLSSLIVTMAGGSCGAGSVAVTSTGTAPISDCVGGANTVDGASAVPTTFRPDPNLTSTPSGPVSFVGNDESSGGSVLDLSALTSPDSGGHTVSGLTIAMQGDSEGSPGSVTANVDASPVTFASFSGVNELIGSGSLANAFQRGSTTNVTLIGIPKLPQSVTFTSTAPSSPIVGDTYAPRATGGSSQDPIVITINPTSAKDCSMSRGTVKFTAVGLCRIDANQVGNGEYTAAPQAQQTAVVHLVPSHEIAVLLAREIIPSNGLRIRSLLRAGADTLHLAALERGTVSVRWYQLPAGAHLARRGAPVLIAAGKLTFSDVGTGKLRLTLTRAGRNLLRHAQRITLTATGTFTPTGAKSVSVVKRFTLRR
jgi:hypothetical protein